MQTGSFLFVPFRYTAFQKTTVPTVALARIVWYYIFDIYEHFGRIMLRLVIKCFAM